MNAKEKTPPQPDAFSMPMAYPSKKSKMPEKGSILAGDVGGTKTNLALYRIENGQFLAVKEHTYPTADFKSFTDMESALRNPDLPIDGLCLGVAGPVTKLRGGVHFYGKFPDTGRYARPGPEFYQGGIFQIVSVSTFITLFNMVVRLTRSRSLS